jgi:hypothetical protein
VALDPIAADRTSFERPHREGVTKVVNSRVPSESRRSLCKTRDLPNFVLRIVKPSAVTPR